MTRTSTSEFIIDLALSSIFALVGENVGNQIGTEYTPSPKATWLFFNLRITSQIALLIYNAIVLVFAVQQNHSMLILSAVRCSCIIITTIIHYFICTRLWTLIAGCEGDIHKKFYRGYLFCALSYYLIGAISAGIDPYFASDRNAMIVFFLLPFILRISFVIYTKIYTKMMVGRVIVDTSSSNHNSYTILCALLGIAYGLLAIIDATSLWLIDRIVISLFMLLMALGFHLTQRTRMAADQRIRQKNSSIIPVDNGYDNDETAEQRRRSMMEVLEDQANDAGNQPCVVHPCPMLIVLIIC